MFEKAEIVECAKAIERCAQASPGMPREDVIDEGVLAAYVERLREFGVELAESVEIRIWDSSAELRYLVLPERPAGTESLSEAELAELVTRDAMIGVAVVQPPTPAAR